MRRRLALAALCPALALLAPACVDDDAAPPAGTSPPTLRVVAEGLDAVYLGVWGASRSDVWAVGGALGGGAGAGRVLHLAGSAWSAVDAAGAPGLWWTWGSSPSDVWMVGDEGTILHFDGQHLARVDGGHAYSLFGVWGSRADDVWAVGGDVASGGTPIVRHFDGAAWADATTGLTLQRNLFKVWGSTANDVFVVGDHGTALHFDGARWTALATPTTERLVTVSGRGASDVYAVGGIGAPTLVHWDGAGFAAVPLGDELPGLNGVWAAPGRDAWAAGYSGLVLSEHEGAWTRLPKLTSASFHAIWSDGAGTVVAAGGNLFASSRDAANGTLVATADVPSVVLAGPGDASTDTSVDAPADVSLDVADAGADVAPVADASLDDASDASDVAVDAADAPLVDDAAPEAGTLGPGADCSGDADTCSAGLDCWGLVDFDGGATQVRCSRGCTVVDDCPADAWGAGACCAIPGPQTFTMVCIPSGVAGCP